MDFFIKVVNYIRFLRLFSFKKLFLCITLSICVGVIFLSFSAYKSIKPFINNLLSQLNAEIIMIDFYPKRMTGLNYKDILKLKKIPFIVDICGYEIENGVEIRYKHMKELVQVLYISENFYQTARQKILWGRFFKKTEFLNKSKVCVVGFEVYKKLKPRIEDYLEIKRTKYKIIGVLNKKTDFAIDKFIDNCIILPLFKEPIFFKHLILSTTDFKKAKMFVEYYIIKNKKLSPGEFNILSIEPFVKWKNQQLQLWTIGGMVIGLLIFLLASIGIWIIFSIDVNIRKKEIGILRSIGAKKKDIFFQFIVEGVLIGIMGWNLGIVLIILFLPFLSYFYKFFIYPAVSGIIISFLMVNIFTLLGIIPPAKKATSIYPQEVLRYE